MLEFGHKKTISSELSFLRKRISKSLLTYGVPTLVEMLPCMPKRNESEVKKLIEVFCSDKSNIGQFFNIDAKSIEFCRTHLTVVQAFDADSGETEMQTFVKTPGLELHRGYKLFPVGLLLPESQVVDKSRSYLICLGNPGIEGLEEHLYVDPQHFGDDAEKGCFSGMLFPSSITSSAIALPESSCCWEYNNGLLIALSRCRTSQPFRCFVTPRKQENLPMRQPLVLPHPTSLVIPTSPPSTPNPPPSALSSASPMGTGTETVVGESQQPGRLRSGRLSQPPSQNFAAEQVLKVAHYSYF